MTVALVQTYLAYRCFKLVRSSKDWYAVPLLIVICGIVYDNLVIGTGVFIGEGDLLKTLNIGRFVIHALFTPMIIIFALGVAKRVGVGFAQNRIIHTVVCLSALGLIAFGFYEDIVKSVFVPVAEMGTLRYKPQASMPPIPAILTIIFTMVMGAFVWWRTRKLWFFLGPLAFFFMAPFAAKFLWVGNLGEVLMNLGLVSGEINAQNIGNDQDVD